MASNYNIEVFQGFHICPQFSRTQDIDIRYNNALRVGKNGYDKNATIEEIIEQIAIPNKAHVIIKRTPNSKWYVKQIDVDRALEIIREKSTNYITHPEAKTYIVRF
jgi:hypothetical protein